MFSRRKIAALVAEFLGTGILAFVVITVSRSQIGIPYFYALAAGIVVILFGLALGRDVMLNPAYTFALWTARKLNTVKALGFIAAQILGGMAAYNLYKYFAESNVVQPLPDEFKEAIFLAEVLGTFIFTFGAAAALYRNVHPYVRNVATGGAYAIGVIAASVASAGFINPSVAIASNAAIWLTYIAGPVVGALLGVNLYGMLFANRDRAARVAETSAATARKAVVSKTEDEDEDEDDEAEAKAARKAEAKKKLNDEAIEVSPASVKDKPLAKVAKAEKNAKSDKSKKKKSKK